MKKYLAAIMVSILSLSVYGLTVKEKAELQKEIEYENDKDEGTMFSMKDKCGFTVPISFEYRLLPAFKPSNESAPAYCAYARLAMEGLCKENKNYKDAIKSKVKKIHCDLADEIKGNNVTFKDGTLFMTFSPKSNKSDLLEKVTILLKKIL